MKYAKVKHDEYKTNGQKRKHQGATVKKYRAALKRHKARFVEIVFSQTNGEPCSLFLLQ
jgi:hypothetical protein